MCQAATVTGEAATKLEAKPFVMADPYPPYPVAIVGAASEDEEDYDEEIAKLEAKKKAKRDRMKFNRSLESTLPQMYLDLDLILHSIGPLHDVPRRQLPRCGLEESCRWKIWLPWM